MNNASSSSTASPTVAAGKNDKAAQPELYRLNPTPKERYEVRLTIEDAPGPFEQIRWSAMYQAKGCNYVVNEWAGVRGEPEKVLELPFEVQADGSYVATVFLDAMLDEDYYGNGVCKWELSSAGSWFKASDAPGDAAFVADVFKEQLIAEKPFSLFYWKGYYPRTELDTFSTSGNLTREKFSSEIRTELFSMSIHPKKVLP